jgi:hypothetical protein
MVVTLQCRTPQYGAWRLCPVSEVGKCRMNSTSELSYKWEDYLFNIPVKQIIQYMENAINP